MSGSSGTRGDDPVDPTSDPCSKKRRGPINSPQPPVITTLKVGSLLTVRVNEAGTRPILEVVAQGGLLAGSLTFVGYHEIIDCIRIRGVNYRAVVISISGGAVEVSVEPI